MAAPLCSLSGRLGLVLKTPVAAVAARSSIVPQPPPRSPLGLLHEPNRLRSQEFPAPTTRRWGNILRFLSRRGFTPNPRSEAAVGQTPRTAYCTVRGVYLVRFKAHNRQIWLLLVTSVCSRAIRCSTRTTLTLRSVSSFSRIIADTSNVPGMEPYSSRCPATR